MLRRLIVATCLISLLVLISFSPVWAAQLNANIDPLSSESIPQYKFLRTVFIEYTDGGEVADILRNQKSKIQFTADSETPGVRELITKMNQNLDSHRSNVLNLIPHLNNTNSWDHSWSFKQIGDWLAKLGY